MWVEAQLSHMIARTLGAQNPSSCRLWHKERDKTIFACAHRNSFCNSTQRDDACEVGDPLRFCAESLMKQAFAQHVTQYIVLFRRNNKLVNRQRLACSPGVHCVPTVSGQHINTHKNIILSSMTSSKWSLPTSRFPAKTMHALPVGVPCVLRLPPVSIPWFYQPNNIQWRVQIMKFVIIQFPPAPRHFLPPRSECSPGHLVLSLPMFLPHTPIQQVNLQVSNISIFKFLDIWWEA